MSSIFVEMLRLAKKVNNYIEDATDNAATNLKWTSTTAQTYTVPALKRWYLVGGMVKPDASSTVSIQARDSAGKIIHWLAYASASTNVCSYPQSATIYAPNFGEGMLVLDPGEDINISMGAAQGAGATASCVVYEVDI